MKKSFILILSAILIINMFTLSFAGTGNQDLDIKIVSPEAVSGYPGIEEVIKAEITNNGTMDLQQVLAYVTMADLGKNMTVNLEDYSADKPIYIESLKAGETQSIELPIRFVYTSNYYLYVTVVSKTRNLISSSNAIPIEILGNTKINKPLAMGVTMIEPVLMLGLVGLIYGMRRKKYKVK